MFTKWVVKYLCKQLAKDPDYYRSWQANIAMAFYDEAKRDPKIRISRRRLALLSNIAAKNFLDLLIGPLEPCASNPK